jgi:DNA polymerase I-like protein with 3'-5' exonuclease and polymerase domains
VVICFQQQDHKKYSAQRIVTMKTTETKLEQRDTRYPNLEDAKIIAFDIECYDPELESLGPGVYRKDGNILGYSIANGNGFAEYYNLAHKDVTGEEKRKNLSYARRVFSLPVRKLAHFAQYDLDWLENWLGVPVQGELNDIQVAETLLNENLLNYDLDTIAARRLNKHKKPSQIDAFCEQNQLKGKPIKWLYIMPYKYVRDYAIGDVQLPIEIFRQQWEELKHQGLFNLYQMEMQLTPLLLQMRRQGVRIDKTVLTSNITEIDNLITEKKKELYSKYGEFNYNSSKQIAEILDKLEIAYPKTDKGNPNIDQRVLTFVIAHPIADQILELRKIDKILGTFLVGALLQHSVDDRIHCNFYPTKTEDYGTKSGRFSSAHPNLQQVPSRDEVYSSICRKNMIPEENCWWSKLDWSQIEYRFMAHYARGPRSSYIRKRYNDDPNTDYHQLIMDWTGLDRKTAKTLNFGMAYMMGAKKMHRQFGWDLDECYDLIEQYNEEVPFIKVTRDMVTDIASKKGFITTILNRRARLTPEMVRYHKEYQMFNRLIQGSAADLMKKSMVEAYKAGIFSVLKPHLTVHDELDVSTPKTKEGIEALRELKNIMETCIKLDVPIVADVEIGTSWADVEETNLQELTA